MVIHALGGRKSSLHMNVIFHDMVVKKHLFCTWRTKCSQYHAMAQHNSLVEKNKKQIQNSKFKLKKKLIQQYFPVMQLCVDIT